MDIYTFIYALCDTSNIVFSLFDCNSGNLIKVPTEDGEKTVLNYDELLWSDYSDYEIGGIDVWTEKATGNIHFEFNIDVDVDAEEEEEDE